MQCGPLPPTFSHVSHHVLLSICPVEDGELSLVLFSDPFHLFSTPINIDMVSIRH